MEAKPFHLQSPEGIAKEYAGNKQRIAQAMQSGLLDPTSALMAGMFIDRMRSAQFQEQGAPPTVAQQVFSPAQSAPQPGLGMPGAPQATPQMAPQQAPPPQMGMAEGGLAGLPVPDNMYDAPSTDAQQFGGGGVVAFADGGGTSTREMLADIRARKRVARTTKEYNELAADEHNLLLQMGRIKPRDVEAEARLAQLRELGAEQEQARNEGFANLERDARTRASTRMGEIRDALTPDAKPRSEGIIPDTVRGIGSVVGGIAKNWGEMFDAGGLGQAQSVTAAGPALYRNPGDKPIDPRFYASPEAWKTQPTAPAAPTAPAVPGTPPAGAPAPAHSAAYLAAKGVTPSTAPRGPGGGGRAPAVSAAPAAPALPTVQDLVGTSPGGSAPGAVDTSGFLDAYKNSVGTPPTAKTSRQDALDAYYEKQMSPEAMAKQKKEDMWTALAQMGLGMMSTKSPNFLQSVGEAGAAALPGLREAVKDRKAREAAGLQALAQSETSRSAAELQRWGLTADRADKLATFMQTERGQQMDADLRRQGFSVQARIAKMSAEADKYRADLSYRAAQEQNATSIRAAQISASARGESDNSTAKMKEYNFYSQLTPDQRKTYREVAQAGAPAPFDPRDPDDPRYKSNPGTPAEQLAKARRLTTVLTPPGR